MNPLSDYYASLHSAGLISRLLELARDEDLGTGGQGGDVTGKAFLPGYIRGRFSIVARTQATLSGLACIDELLHTFQADADVKLNCADGDSVPAGTTVAVLSGRTRDVLSVERTVLNLVSRLSGIATITASYVAAAKVPGAKAQILDTRKTTPGLRQLEKYAVRCGGGYSHRMGLFDAVLIKDNHLAGLAGAAAHIDGAVRNTFDLAEEVRRAVKSARDHAPRAGLKFIELEVDSLAQLAEVLGSGDGTSCGVHIILLDNMTPEQIAQAVAMRDAAQQRVMLEASGGITLANLPRYAATGVDRISIGALTHQAVSLDFGLDAAR